MENRRAMLSSTLHATQVHQESIDASGSGGILDKTVEISQDIIPANRGFRIMVRGVSVKREDKDNPKPEDEIREKMLKMVEDSNGIIGRGLKWAAKAQRKISCQRWWDNQREQTRKVVQFKKAGIQGSSASGAGPDFTIDEIKTDDSDDDDEKPAYFWSKHGPPGSHPVARAQSFSRKRRSVLNTMKDATVDPTSHPVDSATGVDTHYISTPAPSHEDGDVNDIDTNLVYGHTTIKRSLAQEGANIADPEASGAPTGSSHIAASGAVVPATAAEFTEQVAYTQQMIGVTPAMVSGKANQLMKKTRTSC
jgi:hypothetical protein